MSALNVALEFASRGYAVLAVGPDKRPWTEHGVYSASSDPQVFSRFNWNGAVCAVATGTLEALGGELPNTLAASSPSGGRHYWFKHVDGSRSKDLGPGLQWFSDRKFVLTPPAPGREWLNNLAITEAPDWLVKLVLAERYTHTHTHRITPLSHHWPTTPLPLNS